jgi:hypothetical protein
MLEPILKFFAEYLKNKPFTDVLLIVGIGVFLWIDYGHRQSAGEAHSMVRQVLHERDDREDSRTDKIITALTGIKTEQKKTRVTIEETAATTAAKLESAIPVDK